MLAARDHLRTLLDLDEAGCEVMFDGQPFPSCGETFVAIHPGRWTGIENDDDLEEEIGFYVTVTRRLGAYPKDRWGREIWAKENDGLEAVLRKIIIGKPVKASNNDWGLHRNNVVMQAANTTYITATYAGFSTPVKFMDGGQPLEKGPEWFNATTYESQLGAKKFPNAGVAQTLTFGGARRTQGLPHAGFDES